MCLKFLSNLQANSVANTPVLLAYTAGIYSPEAAVLQLQPDPGDNKANEGRWKPEGEPRRERDWVFDAVATEYPAKRVHQVYEGRD